MYPRLICATLAFVLASVSYAEETDYWSIELPVPESASNVVRDVDRQYLIKSVTFDWAGEDAASLREFYEQFFESVGWESPFKGGSQLSTLSRTGWAGYAMNFDEFNKPFAAYGTSWKASGYPANAGLTLQLTSLDGDVLQGTATLQISPEVDMAVLFRLNDLLGNDPKNLFRLYEAVQGNPFELHTIALPANYEDETDPLLAEYYNIVDEVNAMFREWEREHMAP
ncbi:MAG: hypothetical protein QNJ23_01965 [Woeseiaceae bacterium]|nr:hypothetical protein [Woeseiaceae bacterium]